MASHDYDLEERTFQFAKKVALYCKKVPRSVSNIEYSKQAVRASGSVGANYIEANESLGIKDFALRAKISRKEAKESAYWIRLIKETNGAEYSAEAEELIVEATKLKKREIPKVGGEIPKSKIPRANFRLELVIWNLVFAGTVKRTPPWILQEIVAISLRIGTRS